MPAFPMSLNIPEALFECHNIAHCPNGEYRPPEMFTWWNPDSVLYESPEPLHLNDRPNSPWEHRVLHHTDTNEATPGWWCCDCISALENFGIPNPSARKTPLTAWLNRHSPQESEGKWDVVLTDITDPYQYFKCGHPDCALTIPPDELSHCKLVFIAPLAGDKYTTPKLNHNWLCVEHTDEFYAALAYNPAMTVQIGPTLQGLQVLRDLRKRTRKPTGPNGRRRPNRNAPA